MNDFFIFGVVFFIVFILAFFSASSFLKKTAAPGYENIHISIKVKLALICTGAFLAPLVAYKSMGNLSLLGYALTIPIAILAIQKLPNRTISLRSASGVFLGVVAKLIVALLIVGALARMIVKALQH